VFALLWGVPYLVAGQGLSPGAASAMLTLLVGVGIVAGPLFGEFTARHPLIGTTSLMWTLVLVVPPPAPRWLLVLLVVVLALGGPASMVAFDYARTFNPGNRQGTAVGIVNVGGFVASLLVALAVGVVLGLIGPADGYSPEAFRGAWTVQYVIWVLALVGVLVARRRARRKMAIEGVVVPPLRTLLAERRRTR
jgi:MFS family permease